MVVEPSNLCFSPQVFWCLLKFEEQCLKTSLIVNTTPCVIITVLTKNPQEGDMSELPQVGSGPTEPKMFTQVSPSLRFESLYPSILRAKKMQDLF